MHVLIVGNVIIKAVLSSDYCKKQEMRGLMHIWE